MVHSENRRSQEEFWALNDVSFEVEQGERLGIIGRNGAGKSTLLKILSRITEPTRGRVSIWGSVSSLLEVGTGFHPELTGRENVFLNGSILGMSRAEITRKFDEIVAFAEVERFLDTPVKRYSSGMYVRLAFSVAAHLAPDILIVDEVLAVGDTHFQKKCLGRMEELSGTGRTVIFVTHSMDALMALCTRGILLDRGTVAFDGPALSAREAYLTAGASLEHSVDSHSGRGGSGGVSITRAWLEDANGEHPARLTRQSQVSLCLEAEVSELFQNRDDLDIGFGIDTEDGRRLFTVVSAWLGETIRTTASVLRIACDLGSLPLVSGKYLLSASVIFKGDTLDSIQHCASFRVLPEERGFHAERIDAYGPLDLPCRFRDLTHRNERLTRHSD